MTEIVTTGWSGTKADLIDHIRGMGMAHENGTGWPGGNTIYRSPLKAYALGWKDAVERITHLIEDTTIIKEVAND